MNVWQLHEAKNRLSEVVEKALNSGPQVVTRRGKESVVVISYDEYRRLKTPKQTLSDFFRTSPLADVDLELPRDDSPGRPAPEL